MYNIGYINTRGQEPDTGVGTYRSELLKRLMEFGPSNEFYIKEIRNLHKFSKIGKSFFSIKKDFDLIHFETDYWWYVGVWLQKLLYEDTIKVILTNHGDIGCQIPRKRRTVKQEIRSYLNKRFAALADGIVTVSKSEKNLMSEYLNVNKDRIFVTYNGNSMLDIYKEEASSHELWQEEDFILHVSNGVDWAKNPELLLRSFHKFTELETSIELIIIGEGWFDKKIDNLIEELRLTNRVRRKGKLKKRELKQYYKNAKLYLQTSRHESFGLPIVEAMTFGTPVVSTKVGAVPEIAQDVPIYVDNDPEDIALKLLKLLRNPELYRVKSQKAKNLARNYTWSRSAKETLKVYEKVLGSS